jgi:ABC-type branched-subunit amino acid transport system substrate-binding protein
MMRVAKERSAERRVRPLVTLSAVVAGVLALAALSRAPALAQCTTTIGVVMELTGPAAQFGQAGAKSVELAFRDLNEAGGVAGCRLAADIRDSQSQGSVAVDAAKQLVEIKRVPALIGGIISSVSIPIVTSVTAPAGIVQISPASTSPTLTNLGREGKTGGWFFRTITTDALQGIASARYALDSGLRRLTVIHVNNDFGVNMVKEFSRAYRALGGTIVSVTPYNPSQASYQPEVTRAMQGSPDALYLVSYPVDGATIARQWISLGGVKKFLLNDGMNSAKFIQDVGAQHLGDAYGTSSGTTKSPSTEYFAREYPPFAKFEAGAPAADRSYDAAAILGLAIAHAGKAESAAIRDSIRKVLDPTGAAIHAGATEFRKGLALLKEGKPIRYVGVIGPVQFDRYGDITGPFRLWRIQGGQVTTVGEMSVAEVDQLKARLGD